MLLLASTFEGLVATLLESAQAKSNNVPITPVQTKRMFFIRIIVADEQIAFKQKLLQMVLKSLRFNTGSTLLPKFAMFICNTVVMAAVKKKYYYLI